MECADVIATLEELIAALSDEVMQFIADDRDVNKAVAFMVTHLLRTTRSHSTVWH